MCMRLLQARFPIQNVLKDVPEFAIYQLVSASRYLAPRTIVQEYLAELNGSPINLITTV